MRSKHRIALLAALAFGLSVAGCGASPHKSASPTKGSTAPHRSTTPSFPALIASVRTGVIRIEASMCGGGMAVGTGFLLSPTLIATVEHVVDGASLIDLKRGSKVLATGTVIGQDAARDVALIRSSRPIAGHVFRLASAAPQLGDDVAALGFPLGLPLTLTRGTVSGLNRTIPIGSVDRQRLVQTDAAVNPGNSGGPLLTDSGAVVGLVDLGTNQANGISFAVSAAVAGPLLQAWQAAPQPVAPASCGAPQAAPPAGGQTSGSALLTFDGQYFSIQYPAGWTVQAAEASAAGGVLDTTISDPGNPAYLLRVDVKPGVTVTDPVAAARPVVAGVSGQGGYVLLTFQRETFLGYAAVRWEFLVEEQGVLLHKIDEFFIDNNGNGYGVLTQAPAGDWTDGVAAAFETIQQTLVVK